MQFKMIECKPYKARFLTDRTCIANQRALKEFKKRGIRKDAHVDSILSHAPLPGYYKIHLCDGCKIGEALYKKSK